MAGIWKTALGVSVALMCIAASAQAALPEFSGTLPDPFTTLSGTVTFENEGSSLSLACVTGTEGVGEIESLKVAVVDELQLGCSATISKIKVGKCTGLVDTTSGSILEFETALVAFKAGTLEPVAVISLKSEPHIECPGTQLLLLRGKVCGTTTLSKSNASTWQFKGAMGKQEITKYQREKGGVEEACQLESSINGAAFKTTDQVQTTTLKLTKELAVLD